MKKREDALEVKEGRVIEALPAALFRVEFFGVSTSAQATADNSKKLICFLGGKMKIHKIKILVGDKVLVELDPYDGKGRIVKRM